MSALAMDSWKEYADTYCQVARAMIEGGNPPPAPQFIQGLIGIPISKKKSISPPKISRLAWMLPMLPPLIARKDSLHWLGVASNTLSNADQDGRGPRVRYTINRRVMYPAAYLLEWLESQGMEVKISEGAR